MASATSGPASAYVTHVDDIKIGAMEFKNCMVQVLEQPANDLRCGWPHRPGRFPDYVVTLDIPVREVRLGPLPPRPASQGAAPLPWTSGHEQRAGKHGRPREGPLHRAGDEGLDPGLPLQHMS